jgi:hypothetical protein
VNAAIQFRLRIRPVLKEGVEIAVFDVPQQRHVQMLLSVGRSESRGPAITGVARCGVSLQRAAAGSRQPASSGCRTRTPCSRKRIASYATIDEHTVLTRAERRERRNPERSRDEGKQRGRPYCDIIASDADVVVGAEQLVVLIVWLCATFGSHR